MGLLSPLLQLTTTTTTLVVLVLFISFLSSTTTVAVANPNKKQQDPLLSDEYHNTGTGGGGGIGRELKQVIFQNSGSTLLPPPLEYLGLLVDGGRHFFPIPWLKQLLDYMYILRFNLMHLRLTDDQVFNIQLKSHPDLAYGSIVKDTYYTTSLSRSHHNNNNNPVVSVGGGSAAYTPQELRDLVQYAKIRNITILPEINVPGHGGAWAGIKGMIVDCPKFICNKGYGVPLNVSHPQFVPILTDILREVIDIFDTPPMIHLGGDEVHMSAACVEEVLAGQQQQQQQQSEREEDEEVEEEEFDENGDLLPSPSNNPLGLNYTLFEEQLQHLLLKDLGYPESQIIRWERTDPIDDRDGREASSSATDNKASTAPNNGMTGRAGKLLHYWESLPGQSFNATAPYFVSRGLYMDTNGMDGAWLIHRNTRRILTAAADYDRVEDGIYLKGIIVGAFELGPEFFYSRNILGRLLAVSMGVFHNSPPYQIGHDVANDAPNGLNDFIKAYAWYCRNAVKFPNSICNKNGFPLAGLGEYQEQWKKVWTRWKEGICTRITEPQAKLHIRKNSQQHRIIMENVYDWYWKEFAEAPEQPEPNVGGRKQKRLDDGDNVAPSSSSSTTSLLLDDMFQSHAVEHVGILLDLVNSLVVPEDIMSILNHTMAPLGLNFLQLRLIDDYGFSMQLGGATPGKDTVSDAEGSSASSTTTASSGKTSSSSSLSSTLSIPRIFFMDRLAHMVMPPLMASPYTNQDLMDIVASARAHSIEVMPEIVLSTNAGGWFNGGFLLDCPDVLCEKKDGSSSGSQGQHHHLGMTHNVTDGSLLPLLAAVIRQLQGIFSTSSGYIHLGADERNQALPCIRESGLTQSQTESEGLFDDFERRLSLLLELQNLYSPNRILRWNNAEQKTYPIRTGRITHYRSTDQPPLSLKNGEGNDPFFATVNLLDPNNINGGVRGAVGAWAIYQKTVEWVQHQPKGLVAEIRAFDSPVVWNKLEYSKRLVAFALATTVVHHQKPIRDHAEFVKVYVPLCIKLMVHHLFHSEAEASSSCLEFAQNKGSNDIKDENPNQNINNIPRPSDTLKVERVTFRERACQLMAKMEYTPITREKALSEVP